MENTEMTYEQRHAKEYEKVSLREQICYGLGDSACNVVYGLCSTLLTFFYTDYVDVCALRSHICTAVPDTGECK